MTRPSQACWQGALPSVIPVFPLAGVLLLPRGELPLNIFEPRYLAMIEDALKHHRMIGMVQPHDPMGDDPNPPLYPTGCAGKITAFSETDDGRYLVTLTGVCRFDILEELPLVRGYRPVTPDWSGYEGDLLPESDADIDRERLVELLKPYFAQHGLSANWDAVTTTEDERLVTTLAMVCPFEPSEKQCLLQAPDLRERARVLVQLLELAVTPGSSTWQGVRH